MRNLRRSIPICQTAGRNSSTCNAKMQHFKSGARQAAMNKQIERGRIEQPGGAEPAVVARRGLARKCSAVLSQLDVAATVHSVDSSGPAPVEKMHVAVCANLTYLTLTPPMTTSSRGAQKFSKLFCMVYNRSPSWQRVSTGDMSANSGARESDFFLLHSWKGI